jgi:hypothetical protein
MVVVASGRRFDARPDVFFERKTHIAHASILEVAVPEGEQPLRIVVASEHDLVLEVKGDVGRVAEMRSHQGENHVAVVGLDTKLVVLSKKLSCRNLLLRLPPDHPAVHQVKVKWPNEPPQEIPCVALACAATPLSWPRDIRLPSVVEVDPARAISSAPLIKPNLLSGYAGLSQLVQRGLLRQPEPGEAESALEAVRTKYVSRLSPSWRPQFGIDFVMTAPTNLPGLDGRDGAGFRVATILVPPSVPVTREEEHCLIAMGPVAPKSGYELALRLLHQPPPYVIASKNQKCLGKDWNLGPSLFRMADRPSAVPVPECQAVEVPAEAVVIGVYDYRDNRGRSHITDWVVDLRLDGMRPVVLVGRPSDLPRQWRVQEAYPGQVQALLLAEPLYNQWPVRVEGLRPEQVVVDAARLADWRNSGDPLAGQAWRSAKLMSACDDRVSLMPLHPQAPSASVSERGFDLSVKVWTGRQLDALHYVASNDKTTIRVSE